jgi:ubiquinone biosynthesis protein
VPFRKQDFRRFSHIASVLARHGFHEFLDRLKARYHGLPRRTFIRQSPPRGAISAPERLRLAFEELGPTFIKFGQVLSSRPDIIPAEYIQELSKLQDDVPEFPFEDARKLIESQLKRPVTDIFLHLDEKPRAAASLAQVHRAKLLSGDDVAVKVQRIGVDKVIENDIRILREFAGLVERRIPESRRYEPRGLVDEFARSIRHELDFVREGRNIDRFRKYFSGTPIVYIPKVYWELTTPKVLTIEYIDGIKITDIASLDAAGLDRKAIAVNGANITLKEVFEFRFFHADPHPGNLFVCENNIIAPVDFGMTGTIEEDVADQMSGVFLAVLEKDVDGLVKNLRALGVAEDVEDIRSFKIDVRDLVDRYYGLPLSKIEIGGVFRELMGIVQRYRLRLPHNFAMIGKALMITEGVGRALYPDFNILEIAKPYARRLLWKRYDPRRQLNEMRKTGAEALDFLKALPTDLKEIFAIIRKGKFTMLFEHRGLELLVDELDRSSNRISFAVVIAALIVGSSLIFQTRVGPTFFDYPIIGLAGFLLASILGIWLLIGIMRSKRL